MPPVLNVVTAEQWDEVYNRITDRLVVVCFSADWCGPCKRLAPEYSEMAAQYPDVRFVKINVDTARPFIPAVATVRKLPSFAFVRNKEQVFAMRGAHPQQLKEKIEALR